MKKVSEADLQQIQTLQEGLAQIISTLGELHLNKFVLEKQLIEITSNAAAQENKFIEFQEKERVLYEKLQQEYGVGTINLETGEITE